MKKDENMEDGIKHIEGKMPYFTVLCKQFPNALRAVVERSLKGHEKYAISDEDWNNWSRVKDPFNTYSNAMMRHIFEEGEDSELEHLAATAWNALARLELKLKKEEVLKEIDKWTEPYTTWPTTLPIYPTCEKKEPPPWGFPTMDPSETDHTGPR